MNDFKTEPQLLGRDSGPTSRAEAVRGLHCREVALFSHDDVTLPLSAAQREIWFGEQQRLNKVNRVYKIGECVEIHGQIDPALFETAPDRMPWCGWSSVTPWQQAKEPLV
jgi:hypothetical protein